MFYFATTCNHDEQSVSGVASSRYKAVVLSFPYKLPKSTIDYAPMTDGIDIVAHRMEAPLNSDEMAAVLGMVRQRTRHLERQLWVTMGTFLATMGVEELGDLRRCDFVRAVKYLVDMEQSSDVSAQMQSMVYH